jgi:hypothetical protein
MGKIDADVPMMSPCLAVLLYEVPRTWSLCYQHGTRIRLFPAAARFTEVAIFSRDLLHFSRMWDQVDLTNDGKFFLHTLSEIDCVAINTPHYFIG